MSVLAFLWRSHVPAYGHATSCLFIHHLWTFGLFPLFDSCESRCCERSHTSCCVAVFFFISLGCILRSGVASQVVTVCLTVWGTATLFSKVTVPPTSTGWGFQWFRLLANLGCHLPFYYRHPSRCEVVSHRGFDLHFPDGKWCWWSFPVLISHLRIVFREMSLQILCLLFDSAVFWIVELWKLFVYSAHQTLLKYVMCKYFFPFHGLSFHLLDGVLEAYIVSVLMKFIYFSCYVYFWPHIKFRLFFFLIISSVS